MESVGFGTTGLGDSYYGALQTQSIAASGNYVIPKGVYIVNVDANGQIQYYNGTAWVSLAPAGTGIQIFSDGATIRVLNTSTTAASTLNLIKVNYNI